MIFVLNRFAHSAFGLATAVKEFAAVVPEPYLRARTVEQDLLDGSNLREIDAGEVAARKGDAWHVDDLFAPFCLAMIARGLVSGRTVIICPHGMLDGWAMNNGRTRFKRAALHLIDMLARGRSLVIHALNPDEARDAKRYLPHAARIEVVPNGVPSDILEIRESLPPRSQREGPIVIGCMSRIAPKKNQLAVVELAARMRDLRPETFAKVEFRIDGQVEDEDYAHGVRDRIAAEGLGDKVALGGNVPFEQRAGCLSGYDYFLFPSKSEGMPYVVLEAMALGVTPVVADTACCDFVRDYGGKVFGSLDDGVKLFPAARSDMVGVDVDRFLADFDTRKLRDFLGDYR